MPEEESTTLRISQQTWHIGFRRAVLTGVRAGDASHGPGPTIQHDKLSSTRSYTQPIVRCLQNAHSTRPGGIISPAKQVRSGSLGRASVRTAQGPPATLTQGNSSSARANSRPEGENHFLWWQRTPKTTLTHTWSFQLRSCTIFYTQNLKKKPKQT